MQPIHIVGRKNHGKTTLIIELIKELRRRGLRVGAIKHTRHAHAMDEPGKDSYRLRESGAEPAAFVSGDMAAVYIPMDPEDDFYALLAPLFKRCDIVLVEGDLDGPGPKIEVWRSELGRGCLAGDYSDVLAVVSDDDPPTALTLIPRSDISQVADFILELAHATDGLDIVVPCGERG